MSRLADEALNLPLTDDETFALDMADLAAHEVVTEDDVEAQYASHMNPLGLVASDLTAVGWDSDDTGATWRHSDHGTCTFLEATRKEANKVNPPANVENF